jgi:hypothetical protein
MGLTPARFLRMKASALNGRLLDFLALRERPDPIPKFPAHGLMLSQLGFNVPVRDSFSTNTSRGPFNCPFALDGIFDQFAVG